MSGIRDKLARWVLKGYDTNSYVQRFLRGDDLETADYTWTPESAMRIAAVYACVQILAETIASLPLRVYRDLEGGGQEEATDHPIYDLIYRQPSRYETAFEWVEKLVTHVCLRGNHVSLIIRDGGRVTQLLPVHPAGVTLEEYENVLVYRVTDRQAKQFRLLAEDVLHVRGLTTDGYWGLSPVGQAKDAFDLARRIQKYGASVFDSGGAKRVLLKFPDALDDKAIENLRRSWEELGKNSAKTAVLESGGDATTIGMNADEAQYLETRRMTVADIARIYRVPLVLLQEHDKTASYASVEQFDLMFWEHTIRPWCKRIEARIDKDLIRDAQYFCKFNMDAIARGDMKTRTEALKTRFMHGETSINEWRSLEGKNPIAESWADQHFVPANLIPIERAGEQPAVETPSDGVGGSDNEPKDYLVPVARDIAQRIVHKEIRELPRVTDLNAFQEAQRIYIYRALRALFEAAGIEDEDRREAMATRLAAVPQAGEEIDPEHRQEEVFALLMAAIEPDAMKSARWHVTAAAARRAIEQAAACDADSPRDT